MYRERQKVSVFFLHPCYVSLRRVHFALVNLLKTDVQYFIRGKEHFSLEAPRRDKQLFFSYLKNSDNAKLFICSLGTDNVKNVPGTYSFYLDSIML